MFLPIGDQPNPPTKAYVTWALMALNVMVFVVITLPLLRVQPSPNDPLLLEYLHHLGVTSLRQAQAMSAQMSAYDLVVFQYGFKSAAPSVTTLFSSLFLHAGILHLAGNMLFLWIFGDNVEHRLGWLNYLIVYLFGGIMATLFFALFMPNSYTPLLGASGAISGVLGCYFVWFPQNKVKTFIFLFPFIMDSFYLPARLVLGVYLIVDNLVPFLFTQSGSGVAHGAHLGGFLAGGVIAFGVDHLPLLHRKRQLSRQHDGKKEDGSVAEQLTELIEHRQFSAAATAYFTLRDAAQRLQIPSALLLQLAYALYEAGDHDAALMIYRRFIAERSLDPALDQAYFGAGKVLLKKRNRRTSAYHYFLTALDVTNNPTLAQAARQHLREIDSRRDLTP